MVHILLLVVRPQSKNVKIGEIVRYLLDKNGLTLQLSLLRGSRPISARSSLPHNVLRVLQISSKSVYFLRIYSRTREH